MKSLTLLALFPLTSFGAFGNDGPSAMPPTPGPAPAPYVIASMTKACGFMCPNGDFTTLTINSLGEVDFYKGDRVHPQTVKMIAKLSAEGLGNLYAQVKALKAQDLVDYNPGPECMDAPTTTYLVKQNGSKEIKLAQEFGCHMHGFADHSGENIVKLLDGLATISR